MCAYESEDDVIDMSKFGFQTCAVGDMNFGHDSQGLECWKNENDGEIYYVTPFLNQNSKYYIFSTNDIAPIKELINMNSKEDTTLTYVLDSLTSLMKVNKNKRICLRQLPDPNLRMAGGGFFAEEVLEIIPLVLRQQGASMEENDARLAAYRVKYTPKESHLHTLVPYSDFLDIVENFNIDKTLLTILPDLNPQFYEGKPKAFDPITTIGTDRTEVMLPNQAIWKVFRECVCEYTWKTGKNADLRRLILACMAKLNINEPVMISLKHVEQIIGIIKNNKFYKTNEATFNAFLKMHSRNSEFDPSEYRSVAIHCRLPIYNTGKVGDDKIPLWMMRSFLASGWISQFLEEDHAWKPIIFDCMESFLEDDEWKLLEPILRPLVYGNKSSGLMSLKDMGQTQLENSRGQSDPCFECVADLRKLSVQVNNTAYVSNQFAMDQKTRNKLKPKYFLVRKDLLEKSSLDDLTSFDKFYSKHKNTEIVIRIYYSEIDSSTHFVLFEEAMEIFFLRMKKKYNVRREQLEERTRSVGTQRDDAMTKITKLSDFLAWFGRFGIDHKGIFTGKDPIFHHTSKAAIENPSNPVYFVDYNGDEVMTGAEASFHSFQSLICGRVWKDQQNEHFLRFKSSFCQLLDQYTEPECINVIKKSTVDESIQQLLLGIDGFSTPIPDYLLKDYKSTDNIPSNIIWDKCRKIGPIHEKIYEQEDWDVPNVRITFLRHYLCVFFGNQDSNTHEKVTSPLWRKIVILLRNAEELEEANKKSEPPSEATTTGSSEGTVQKNSENPQATENHTGKSVNKKANTALTEAQVKVEKEDAKKSRKKMKIMEKGQKTINVEKEQRCTKCTENGVALLNAREVLKKTESTAKYNETKAKKTEKVEANLENLLSKMKELEMEIEDLNRDLKDYDDKEKQLKEENEEVLKEIGNLVVQMEREEEKNVEVFHRNNRIKTKFDEVQLQLATKESEREMVKEKKRRNPAPSSSSEELSTFHVPFTPSLPTTDDPDLARKPQWVLEQWKKMKKNFESDEMVQDERDMIEEMLSKSNELELDVRNLVEYELHQFEATCRIYLQNIELNIMKIEKTEDISNMRPLARYPSLSTEFQIEYEKNMGVNN